MKGTEELWDGRNRRVMGWKIRWIIDNEADYSEDG